MTWPTETVMSIEKLKVLAITFVFAASVGIGNVARADLDISDTPLFVSVNIGPNLMFMLDDSGSMFWSFMPEDTFGSIYRNRAKSSAFNQVYYNPEVEYKLPVDHNGDPLPQPRFTAAWMDGYAHYRGDDTDTVNLSNSYRPTWYYDWSEYYYAGGAERAYYYTYDESCGELNNDSCYTKVVVNASSGPGGSDERQNFANWYSYYRTRMFASRAGIGRAFSMIPNQFRLGWGRINKQWTSTIDGATIRAVQQGVRQMDFEQRKGFYDWLYSTEPTGGTPLRRSLEGAGEYFNNESAIGPWSSTPGVSGGDLLSCRQSFSILMTDGFWNGGSPSVGNADGSGSVSHTGPDDMTGGYTPSDPFQDSYSNTLADVAMYYWKNDLHSTLENRVPSSDRNPAFWQHMVTYTVGLGVQGSIDPDEAFAAIETGDSVDWPEVWADAGGPNIDDMLHAAVNSRGGFFSARDPETFALELAAVLADIIARTAATTGVSVSATRLTTDSLVYAAEFDSNDWTGELRALNADDGSVEYLATEQLASTGHAARNVFTYDPAAESGLAFTTGASGAIGDRIVQDAPAGEPWTAENIINYIRGSDALEGSGAGAFRPREVMLGDIVNSRPAFSGSGNEGWARVDSDYLDYIDGRKNDPRDCDEVEGTCYYARKDTVFIGANDGMLHAFDARTLQEFFAYVPAALHDKLHHLAHPDYGHKFFVDGQVAISDAKIGGSWGTYLVGTLGAGGRGVFALDVTNPENFGANDVLWELTAEDDPDLGYTFGEPIISRLEDGTWVAVFGNGYNSENGQAHLFVVRLSDGEILHKVQLSNTTDNGLSGVVGWRDPGTRTYLQRIYAGDLKGTMWRVDFNSSEPSKAFTNGLFTDPNGRAITATPNVAAHPSGGLMVYFGTGKLIENSDRIEANLERFFAIRDQNSGVSGNNNLNNLAEVEISTAPAEDGLPPLRILESEDIKEDGWYIDLAVGGNATGERTLAKARVVFGTVIIATYEPIEDPCTPGGIQRTYVMDALSGDGALPFCPSCGAVEVGTGAPFSPPLAIKQRPPGSVGDVTYPGHDDPADPGEPGDFPGAPPSDTGTREGWCSEFGIPPLIEGGSFLPLGTICEGRQVWREMM